MARYQFGVFELDTRRQLLTCGGDTVALTPKALAVLAVLVEQAGELVDKRQLLDAAWPGRFVGESVLPQNIYTLRSLFAQKDPATVYIETLPRRGYRFAPAVTVVECGPSPIRSLAVLPFETSPVTAESEALGLAMADSLATQLSRLGRLRVVPTSAVREGSRRGFSLDELGARLRVDAVVTGLVQERAGRLRMNCQLVELGAAETRWVGSFDAALEEVFEVQDEISAALAAELLPSQAGAEPPRPVARTSDPGAYRAYVRGRFLWNRRTGQDLEAAVEQFLHAISLDPAYGPAHAGLADAYVLLPFYSGVAPRDAFPLAKKAALTALDLDARSAAASTTLAYARFLFDWDWPGAEAAFHRALAEDPGYAQAHHWYGFMLSALGRHEEAAEHVQRATELDPLSLAINADLGFVHYFARDFESARHQFELTLELDRGFYYARFGLSLVLEQLDRADAGLEQARLAHDQADENPALIATYARALAIAGETRQAEAILAGMAREPGTKSIYRALVLTGLARAEEALDALELACDERSRFVAFLDVWPIYDPLRSHPRFDALRSRVGLRS